MLRDSTYFGPDDEDVADKYLDQFQTDFEDLLTEKEFADLEDLFLHLFKRQANGLEKVSLQQLCTKFFNLGYQRGLK